MRADKEREAADGHDGTWVAPGLVAVAKTRHFKTHVGANQLHRLHDEDAPSASSCGCRKRAVRRFLSLPAYELLP